MKCPSCGGRNPDDAVRCAHCGEQLNTDKPAMKENIRPRDENFDIRPVFSGIQESKMTPEEGRQKMWVIAVITAVGVLLAAAAVFTFAYLRENQRIQVTTAASTIPEESGLMMTESEDAEETITGITIEEKTKATEDYVVPKTTEGSEETTPEESTAVPTQNVAETTAPVPETQPEETTETQPEPQTEITAGQVIMEDAGMLFLLQNGQSILYKSYSTDAVIQIADVVLGYPFSGVGEGAFSESSERREGLAYGPYVQKVNLPASVTWIGAEAFTGCSLLQEVYIPESVTMIDDSAFAGSAVTIIAAPGSYAWAYAEAHGILVMEGTHTTP